MGQVAAAVAAVLIVAIVAAVVIYHRRKLSQDQARAKGLADKGDLNAKQERQILAHNAVAVDLFRSLLMPSSTAEMNDITVLGLMHRAAIQTWLEDNADIQRGIGR